VACRFDTYYLTAYCRLRSPRRGLPRRETDPARLLPLTPLAFSILLALADQDLHGYAIAQRIGERDAGSITLAGDSRQEERALVGTLSRTSSSAATACSRRTEGN
jgi:hypothetical protein